MLMMHRLSTRFLHRRSITESTVTNYRPLNGLVTLRMTCTNTIAHTHTNTRTPFPCAQIFRPLFWFARRPCERAPMLCFEYGETPSSSCPVVSQPSAITLRLCVFWSQFTTQGQRHYGRFARGPHVTLHLVQRANPIDIRTRPPQQILLRCWPKYSQTSLAWASDDTLHTSSNTARIVDFMLGL